MGYLVLPHRFPPENAVPERSVRDHSRFIRAALMKGGSAVGVRLMALSGLIGGSVLAYAIFAQDLPWLWALVTGLLVVLVVFAVGACTLFSEAYAAAIRFRPSWEQLQTRADTLWALYNAEKDGADEARFKAQFAASHSPAVLGDLDAAAKAGHPLTDVTREDVRQATLSDLPKIANAFDDAAERFRKAEEEEVGG